MKIIDPKGKWYLLSAVYPFYDHESGAYLEPGVPTRMTPTAALAGQEAITEIPSPLVDDVKVPEFGKDTKK